MANNEQQALAVVPRLIHAAVQNKSGVDIADTAAAETGIELVNLIRESGVKDEHMAGAAAWLVALGAAMVLEHVANEADIDLDERLQEFMRIVGSALDDEGHEDDDDNEDDEDDEKSD